MRRSRKYNWKKGGVDCRVSRRGRDFTNTFGPTTSLPSQLNTQSKEPREEFAGKSFTGIFQKCPLNLFWPPPLIIFLQPQTEHFHFQTPLHAHSLMEQTPQEPDSTRPPA